MTRKNYDIALICDDAYVMPTMVTIQSVIHSISISENVFYHIHVCSYGLSEENIRRLTTLSTSNATVSVDIFQPNKSICGVTQKTHVSKVALIKLDLPFYYSHIDKLLYLDSDIIVLQNLEELLDLDIADYYLAASFEYLLLYYNFQYRPSKISKDEFYFNSGVMLLNLKKMREDDIPKKLWENKLSNSKTLLMDQECLNNVCALRCIPLSCKWNFNPTILEKEHLSSINNVFGEHYSSVDEMRNDIRILHYVAKSEKPWIYSTAKMQGLWQKEYDSLELEYSLNLTEYHAPKQTIKTKVENKINRYGFWGTVSYAWYRLKILFI